MGDSNTAGARPGGDHARRWRLVAIISGLIAAVSALAVGFMPVVQQTSEIVWPDGNDTRPVNAPLVSYWAQDMQVKVPCPTVRSVDARTTGPATLFATVPQERKAFGAGLQLQVEHDLLTVINQGQQVAQQPLPPAGCDIEVSSNAERTTVTAGGTPSYDEDGDQRARVVGIYSDVRAGQDPIAGLHASVTPERRYSSTPTVWKTLVTIIGAVALIVCLIAVNRMDLRVARRAPRWAPVGWWRVTARDLVVVGVLGLWVFIGPVTADDGYILTMSRLREDIGYLANYYRWLNVSEAPFGWNDHLLELMSHVSTAPPWVRLPSFLLGVFTWFLLSREVLPRLGKNIRISRAAGWAAGAVFLVAWTPFNTGTRPEPWIAAGALLAFAAVERTLVTRRLLPLCLGLLAAAFSVGANPTGIIAVAPFLVAARPLFRLLRTRAREIGAVPVLLPIFASGVAVLWVVFADQTIASVLEAVRLRSQIGPNQPWYDELSRYQLLFDASPDGALSRRFPILLLLLCIATCFVVLLRRGRIRGAALGPSRRLIGIVALFFLLFALTPTKWTHHFGGFAGAGAALAALTALAVSAGVLRSHRNRMAFLAALLAIAALAAAGPNGYWFVSRFGVPWNDIPPSVFGLSVSSLLVGAAGIAAAIAFVENIRAGHRGRGTPEKPMRALAFGSAGLVAVCGLFVAGEVGSMLKAIHKQRSSYSLGGANFAHLSSSSCNLSDHVLVEQDPNASVLTPLPADQQHTVRTRQRPPGDAEPPLQRTTERVRSGFHTRPADYDDPIGKPPHSLKRGKTSMWSSFREKNEPTGYVRTDWYAIPPGAKGKDVALSVAGKADRATSITAEFGTPTPRGIKVVRTKQVPMVESESSPWADTRFPVHERQGGTRQNERMVRIVVEDNDLTEDGWIAFTQPRIPRLTTLTQRIGNELTYVDWPASFVHPCVRPPAWHDGIAEVPKYRITAGSLAGDGGVSSSKGGGPVGFIEEVANQPEVPSFVRTDPKLPWGQLFQVEPYENGAPPKVIRGEEVHPGWWSPGPGPGREKINGQDPTR